jgi:hypothetical protein
MTNLTQSVRWPLYANEEWPLYANEWSLYATLTTIVGVTALYSILCEMYPQWVSTWNSNAFSSTFQSNHHTSGFLFQGILYNVYHTTTLCRLCHLTVFSDALGWMFVLYYMTGPWGLVVMSNLLLWQSRSFEHMTLCLLTAVALLGCIMGCLWIHWIGATKQMFYYSVLFIGFGPLIRSLGHLAEVAPPIMLDGSKPQLHFRHADGPSLFLFLRYAFQSPRNATILVWGPLIGYISELQAGLPYRLAPFAFYTYTRFWLSEPSQWTTSWKQIEMIKKHILELGWNGWEVTRSLFSFIKT